MKILYYDCFSGISGDMNLGAMIDLGVDREYLIQKLRKLKIGGYTLNFSSDQRKGITGTRADVILSPGPLPNGTIHPESSQLTFAGRKDDHTYSSGDHRHSGSLIHQHVHQEERNFQDICNLIEGSALNQNVKSLSIAIFEKIARAEAQVHGKPIHNVHFHEVGAVDSIVDIVGAAICVDALKPGRIISSPLELGGGMVQCAHGTFPVPAPATLEILKNMPVKLGAVQSETTTPTGAAIIATLAEAFSEHPELSVTRIGYGIGHRNNEIPNVLRVCLSETGDKENEVMASMIECNIDDMNPEFYEYVMGKLFEAGADDVFFQPIVMKKTRPATKVCVLCKPELRMRMQEILFAETTTLGVRAYEVHKTMLERSWKTIETRWGEVRIKQGYLNDTLVRSKPEYEDCLRISKENNITLASVYKEIEKLISDC